MATHERKWPPIPAPIIVIGLGALCLGSATIGAVGSRHLGESTYKISYADFISVMLTGISVMMTVLAIFLAVMGVMGWNAITTSVGDRTERFLKEGFEEGKPLHEMLQVQVTAAMYQGVSALESEPEAEDEADDPKPGID